MITDFRKRKLRVTNLISSYMDLRGLWAGFLARIPDALQNNEYSVTVILVNENKIEVTVLGAVVEVCLDYVIVNNNMWGLIKCEEILPTENGRRTLVTNYFDGDGWVYLTPNDEQPIKEIHDQYYPGTILFQICEALISHHIIENTGDD